MLRAVMHCMVGRCGVDLPVPWPAVMRLAGSVLVLATRYVWRCSCGDIPAYCQAGIGGGRSKLHVLGYRMCMGSTFNGPLGPLKHGRTHERLSLPSQHFQALLTLFWLVAQQARKSLAGGSRMHDAMCAQMRHRTGCA